MTASVGQSPKSPTPSGPPSARDRLTEIYTDLLEIRAQRSTGSLSWVRLGPITDAVKQALHAISLEDAGN